MYKSHVNVHADVYSGLWSDSTSNPIPCECDVRLCSYADLSEQLLLAGAISTNLVCWLVHQVPISSAGWCIKYQSRLLADALSTNLVCWLVHLVTISSAGWCIKYPSRLLAGA